MTGPENRLQPENGPLPQEERGAEVVHGGHLMGRRYTARVGRSRRPGWQRGDEFFGPGLAVAVHAKGAARGAPDLKIAAANIVGEYASRITGPAIMALYRDSNVLDPSLTGVLLRQAGGRFEEVGFVRAPVPEAAAFPSAHGEPGRPGEPAVSQLAGRLIGENLAVVVDRLHDLAGTPSRTLWATAVSNVVTAFLYLSWHSEDKDRYVDACRQFLAHDDRALKVARVGAEDPGLDGQPWMRNGRAACCLAYRSARSREVPDPLDWYCGNCPMLPAERRRENWVRAAASSLELRRPPM